ncbi:MAG: DHH family phosphoesterase [Candidatus Woesearchaeota archaeon]|nr:DHH family phosphoesterase [Candidatus Woesearchaeota archaeon]
MLNDKDIGRIKEELDSCKRPLFFFHDDADGLCSFLLLYRKKGEGKGIIVKTTPKIDYKFVRKVIEYMPDKIFILDIAMVEQDFLDEMAKMNLNVVWIDHHDPLKRNNVIYFNPRLYNPNDDSCITRICYKVVKNDIWIAMAGSIGDWQIPEFKDDFIRHYPDLMDENAKKPNDVLFSQKIGRLSRILSFVLKGKTEDVVKCMKILTRIKDPYEILNQSTPAGNFIYKRYEKIMESYEKLLKHAKEFVKKGNVFIYVYKNEKFSFSSDLANELLHLYPTKIIVVGREKSGEIKYSIRSSRLNLKPILAEALKGVEGFGGGHEYAAGAVIKKESNEKFLNKLCKEIKIRQTN